MDQAEIVDKFGRYEMQEELGRGAMGIVYRGTDPKINRTVALKCLHAHLLEGDQKIRERFQQEMRALGRLVHPNIVTMFDAGEDADSGQAYIVMEYVEGVSLSQVIKDKRSISIEQIVHIGTQICHGLDFAHSKGVVHRDIKPANILLSKDLKIVKIADFGIARLDDIALTQAECLTGTPHYMSPEQCRGDKLDGRSDLFALGVLLYELLAQEKVFQGDSLVSIMNQVLNHSPQPPSNPSSDIPASLSAVVMKALQKRPADRFASGNEMANALLQATEKPKVQSGANLDDDATRIVMPLDPPAMGATKIAEKKQKSSLARPALLISILLVVVAGLFFVLRESPEIPRPEKMEIETGVEKFNDHDAKEKETALAEAKAKARAKEIALAKAKAEARAKETALAKAEAEARAKEIAIAKAEAEAIALAKSDQLRIKKLSAGLLHFKTTPSGADILINGQLMGISPVSIELVGGKPYELLIRKRGYHALEATIDVPVGETPMNLTLFEE